MSITNENAELAAAAASKFLKGNIPDEELKSCIDTIKLNSGSNAISTYGSYICAVFYWRVSLNANGKQFTGNAGGVGGVGGGSTNGDIYLADGVTFDELVSLTASFQFNGAIAYLNVNFFSSSSKYLGSFHGGGIATCAGTGGGTGSWS